ncbi:hypothetical protein [Hymenobacter rigui]|uniref:Uncharacterized protein n=1 Tax=Hymenobacter rigui TaxID=334424 RepID=A0A3R9MNQ1_9BACT|nr:hypothetical protein [Hymenobacter rigui]RSK50060.1 hypothetical protein EI291_05260 [Hymenobacter rigui]
MAVTIPANDGKTANLYWLSLAVSLVSFLLYRKPLTPTPYLSENIFLFSVFCGYLLIAGLGWPVRKGRRWAKVVLLLLNGPSTVWYLLRLPTMATPWPQMLLPLLSTALLLWAVVIVARDLLRQPRAGISQ